MLPVLQDLPGRLAGRLTGRLTGEAVDSGVTGDGGVMGLMLFVPGWVNSSFIAKYLTILELS